MRTPGQFAMRCSGLSFFLLVLNVHLQSWERGPPFRAPLEPSLLAEVELCQAAVAGRKNRMSRTI
jgi:hypothetical protein